MTADLPLAGRGRRFVATLIDLVLVPALAILLMLVTGVLEHAADWSAAGRPYVRMFLLGLTSYLLLNGWLLWRRGQTVGKAAMGIAIASPTTGGPPPLWKLLAIRALFFPILYLSFIPVVGLVVLIDQLLIVRKQRRCLHDLLCGSSVLRMAPGLQRHEGQNNVA